MYRYIFVKEDSTIDIKYADNIADAASMWYADATEEPQAVIRSMEEIPNG